MSNVWQIFAADNFIRRHFQMHFFLGVLRVNPFQTNGIISGFTQASMSKIQGLFKDFFSLSNSFQGLKVNEKCSNSTSEMLD